MSDVVLVQPKSNGYSELVGKKHIPLGLISACSELIKGYSVKIIDQRLNGWKNILLKELKKDPLCVGITSITGKQTKNALDITKIIRSNSNSKIVWGGVHSTLLPEQTLKNRLIDYVVEGEGEATFYELVHSIERGTDLNEVKGICYKQNGRIIRNKIREFVDLDKTNPAFDLIDLNKYVGKDNAITVETSRGCGYGCSFCVKSGQKWRAMNSKKSFNIIKNLVDDHKISKIWFSDDNFFYDINRINELVDLILKENLDVIWDAPGTNINSIKTMSDQYLNKLVKSGCNTLYVGVESGSDKVLKSIGKNITVKQVLDTNRKLRKYDLKVIYNFMIGFPYETKYDRRQTIRLMHLLKKENSKASISPLYFYTPYPGTKTYYDAINCGFNFPKRLEEWSKFEWRTANLPWIKNKNAIKRLYFLSLFMDNKFNDKFKLRVFKRIFDLAVPIGSYYFDRTIKRLT